MFKLLLNQLINGYKLYIQEGISVEQKLIMFMARYRGGLTGRFIVQEFQHLMSTVSLLVDDIQQVIGPKHSKVLRFRIYPNSVEGLADIKLCKDPSLTYLGQRFLKQQQRILVFTGHIIQFMVVNIEAQYSIWLFNKNNRRDKRYLAQCYKALIQVINKVLLSGL